MFVDVVKLDCEVLGWRARQGSHASLPLAFFLGSADRTWRPPLVSQEASASMWWASWVRSTAYSRRAPVNFSLLV